MDNHLPEQFQFSHDYCLFLHDILAHAVKEAEDVDVFMTQFNLSNDDEAKEFQSLPKESVWGWLEQHGYQSVISEMVHKQVIPALLSDFSHFIFEGLCCSRKAKLTVAYSLFRRPLSDNLFFLEWLLADPADFLDAFIHRGPEALEHVRKKNPSRRLDIIRQAVSRIEIAEMFEPELLDEIRFNKSLQYGFAGVWDQATHLITEHKAIRTAKQNFNFLFSSTDERMSQWDFLYSKLPILLNYAIEIVEALLARIAEGVHAEDNLTCLRRHIGFWLWSEGNSTGDEKHPPFYIKDLSAFGLPGCPACTKDVVLDQGNMKTLCERCLVLCRHCGAEISLLSDEPEGEL